MIGPHCDKASTRMEDHMTPVLFRTSPSVVNVVLGLDISLFRIFCKPARNWTTKSMDVLFTRLILLRTSSSFAFWKLEAPFRQGSR